MLIIFGYIGETIVSFFFVGFFGKMLKIVLSFKDYHAGSWFFSYFCKFT